MNRKYLFFIIFSVFLLKSSTAHSLEFKCSFEEVHSNGTINQGVVLFKNKKLRYEYDSPNLFIIFINDNKQFFFDKKNKLLKPIKQNLELINSIMGLAKLYPNIPLQINKKGIDIKVELSEINSFIKRISIDSKRAKLSLYLKNCDLEKPINNIFFNEDPIFYLN
jgi:hypothetical protein|tara:strand:+ start:213 stop:707 length:495 start_codon:yes stop_codon:yes gene_type:complete